MKLTLKSALFIPSLLIFGQCLGLTNLTGCGLHLTSGTGTSPNDATPQGNVVYQGQFFKENGATTASGSATVYLSNGNYVLQLAGLAFDFPDSSNLTVIVNGSNRVVASFALSATTGTKNYTFSATATQLISVKIHSNSANLSYASAQLQSIIK
jgi:hypothetical protein